MDDKKSPMRRGSSLTAFNAKKILDSPRAISLNGRTTPLEQLLATSLVPKKSQPGAATTEPAIAALLARRKASNKTQSSRASSIDHGTPQRLPTTSEIKPAVSRSSTPPLPLLMRGSKVRYKGGGRFTGSKIWKDNGDRLTVGDVGVVAEVDHLLDAPYTCIFPNVRVRLTVNDLEETKYIEENSCPSSPAEAEGGDGGFKEKVKERTPETVTLSPLLKTTPQVVVKECEVQTEAREVPSANKESQVDDEGFFQDQPIQLVNTSSLSLSEADRPIHPSHCPDVELIEVDATLPLLDSTPPRPSRRAPPAVPQLVPRTVVVATPATPPSAAPELHRESDLVSRVTLREEHSVDSGDSPEKPLTPPKPRVHKPIPITPPRTPPAKAKDIPDPPHPAHEPERKTVRVVEDRPASPVTEESPQSPRGVAVTLVERTSFVVTPRAEGEGRPLPLPPITGEERAESEASSVKPMTADDLWREMEQRLKAQGASLSDLGPELKPEEFGWMCEGSLGFSKLDSIRLRTTWKKRCQEGSVQRSPQRGKRSPSASPNNRSPPLVTDFKSRVTVVPEGSSVYVQVEELTKKSLAVEHGTVYRIKKIWKCEPGREMREAFCNAKERLKDELQGAKLLFYNPPPPGGVNASSVMSIGFLKEMERHGYLSFTTESPVLSCPVHEDAKEVGILLCEVVLGHIERPVSTPASPSTIFTSAAGSPNSLAIDYITDRDIATQYLLKDPSLILPRFSVELILEKSNDHPEHRESSPPRSLRHKFHSPTHGDLMKLPLTEAVAVLMENLEGIEKDLAERVKRGEEAVGELEEASAKGNTDASMERQRIARKFDEVERILREKREEMLRGVNKAETRLIHDIGTARGDVVRRIENCKKVLSNVLILKQTPKNPKPPTMDIMIDAMTTLQLLSTVGDDNEGTKSITLSDYLEGTKRAGEIDGDEIREVLGGAKPLYIPQEGKGWSVTDGSDLVVLSPTSVTNSGFGLGMASWHPGIYHYPPEGDEPPSSQVHYEWTISVTSLDGIIRLGLAAQDLPPHLTTLHPTLPAPFTLVVRLTFSPSSPPRLLIQNELMTLPPLHPDTPFYPCVQLHGKGTAVMINPPTRAIGGDRI
eukprot:TRINITY_DN38345_c0_g1_i1.p1 TRINITY_DN38345_c0_g1~~TRINITY_DN38345_c0_g1_i1.p1  ORF type:complete len:1109 (+),score=140.53 TRINITY_DN38345_c0_g1_i1:48-3374(+)